jgi:hypothetical protein
LAKKLFEEKNNVEKKYTNLLGMWRTKWIQLTSDKCVLKQNMVKLKEKCEQSAIELRNAEWEKLSARGDEEVEEWKKRTERGENYDGIHIIWSPEIYW